MSYKYILYCDIQDIFSNSTIKTIFYSSNLPRNYWDEKKTESCPKFTFKTTLNCVICPTNQHKRKTTEGLFCSLW